MAMRRGPKRSTSAPATGCVKPQMMFCTAIAMAKSAACSPRSCTTGVWNRPRLCRSPMAIDSMIAALDRISTDCPRVSRPVWNGGRAAMRSCMIRLSARAALSLSGAVRTLSTNDRSCHVREPITSYAWTLRRPICRYPHGPDR